MVAVVILTAEIKALLTCPACGANILSCRCDVTEQFRAACDLAESDGEAFEEMCDTFDPIPPLVFTDETTFTAIHPPYVNPNRGPYPGQRMAPIPATAQAILDIGKATRSAGIARAIESLNSFEPRLGAARWRP